MTRYDIINRFMSERNVYAYLEIGTDKGDSLRNVSANVRISVDPNPQSVASFVMTSDKFFDFIRDIDRDNIFRFGVIFIDGLHAHDQVYRDIHNALKLLVPNGVIVLHDCLPTSEQMQEYHNESQQGSIWTGDVWKAFIKARTELPYLMYTIDTDYGCGIIDTKHKAPKKQPSLPSDMETMTYNDFVSNRDKWMNVKGDIINAK